MKFVITTCPIDKTEKIRDEILQEKLVACYLVIPLKGSKYWWKGKITSEEDLLVFKTRDDLVDKVFKRIKELHPYDVPFIAELNLEKVYDKYEDWLNEVTSG
jgi:periplasmic divalent cation tolerance protein